MQDAMLLVAHNYDTYKVENREKEREEIARKAAKMADDVLLREPDRESHPISVLTSITLLAENRYQIIYAQTLKDVLKLKLWLLMLHSHSRS